MMMVIYISPVGLTAVLHVLRCLLLGLIAGFYGFDQRVPVAAHPRQIVLLFCLGQGSLPFFLGLGLLWIIQRSSFLVRMIRGNQILALQNERGKFSLNLCLLLIGVNNRLALLVEFKRVFKCHRFGRGC